MDYLIPICLHKLKEQTEIGDNHLQLRPWKEKTEADPQPDTEMSEKLDIHISQGPLT